MHPLPHRYRVTAQSAATGSVNLAYDGVPPLASAPPIEFGGPGDAWSPEGLLVGAVADCFILTFRAVARATKLAWVELHVSVEGTLERVDGITAFTTFELHATLTVDGSTDEAAALSALERAERGCLISNSLKAPVHLRAEVAVAA
jgi:organic hydroperoxide reductase OsmC/OhrA